jgi:hypothetical protein
MRGYTTKLRGEAITYPAFIAGTTRRKVAEAELKRSFGEDTSLSVAVVAGVRIFFTQDLGNQKDWDRESFRLWGQYVGRVKEA